VNLLPRDEPADLELGHDVRAWWTCWKPDRDLNPRYAGLPDVPRWGLTYEHPAPTETGVCRGGVAFDLPEVRTVMERTNIPGRAVWQVESWDPLTLSPSLLCGACGHHGFIRAGAWVPA
jgi:hypothetical protein